MVGHELLLVKMLNTVSGIIKNELMKHVNCKIAWDEQFCHAQMHKFWDFILPRVKFEGKEILLEGWELFGISCQL